MLRHLYDSPSDVVDIANLRGVDRALAEALASAYPTRRLDARVYTVAMERKLDIEDDEPSKISNNAVVARDAKMSWDNSPEESSPKG